MYYQFFGLTHAPFKITPDTDVFFEGGNRGAILEALIYAISHGEGIVKVTGEVGSGKTMLCRVVQTRLPPRIESVYLANPSVSPDEILQTIAFEMQLTVPRDASRLEVMHALNAHLLERHAQQRQVVIFVEESQGLPISTLEELRLLSNLETQHHKLLQIVLFGQPELDENLRQQNIRQLRERITHSFTLLPLDVEDTNAYLKYRLQAAGYRGPDLFNGRVIAYMSKACAGLTRRLNLVADKALLAAFAEGTHNVSLEHVKAAVRDSEFSNVEMPNRISPLAYALGGIAIGGVLGIGAFMLYQSLSPSKGALTSQATGGTPSQSSAAAEANSTSTPAPSANPQTAPVNASGTEAFAATQHDAQAMAAGADILEQRLQATDNWLGEQRASSFSIQLLGSDDPELLRDYLKTIAKYLEIEKVYVYRTTANRHPSLTLLYGTFATRGEVIETLRNLPDELKFNRPYYRTIQGIRSEIARQRS